SRQRLEVKPLHRGLAMPSDPGSPRRHERRLRRSMATRRMKPPASKNPAWFTRFARWTAHTCGRPSAFLFAGLTIIVWACTGPLFGYSDTWQLVINTGTTIVTFLMVFLIQNTQNRDSAALHVKIDELIRAI